jgi:hypothetical protein
MFLLFRSVANQAIVLFKRDFSVANLTLVDAILPFPS